MNKSDRSIQSDVRNGTAAPGENERAGSTPAFRRHGIAAAVAALFLAPGVAPAALFSCDATSPIGTALTSTQCFSLDEDITVTRTGSVTVIGLPAIVIDASPYTRTLINDGMLISNDLAGIFTAVNFNGHLSGTLTNVGTISGASNSASVVAIGVRVENDLSGTLTNSGTISANSGPAGAGADGVYVNNELTGALINSGTISATVSNGGQFAAGLEVSIDFSGTLTNSGTIRGTGPGGVPGPNWYSIAMPPGPGGTGTINNLAGALLDGQVRAGGSVNLNNAGTLDTRLQGSVVGGNFTQSPTGRLKISAMSAASHGALAAGGSATLAAGTGIRVTGTPSHTLAENDVLTNVIIGGTLSMSTVDVTDNILPLNFAASDNGADGVDLTARSTGLTTVTAAVSDAGLGSGAGAAGALDALLRDVNSQPAELQDFLFSVGSMTTQQDVANAVSQVLPLIPGALPQVALGAMHGTNRVVQARQEGALGRSAGEGFYGDKHFWLKPYGSWADQDDRKGVPGYEANTYGVVFGADAELDGSSRLGAAFSYSRSDVDGNSAIARQSADVDSYRFVLYGSHSLNRATDVNFQAGVGLHRNDGRRTISGPNLVARSDYRSWGGSVGGGISHTMKWSDKTSFTPSARADYAWIRDKRYAESGAGALNLEVDSNTTGQFIVALDGKLTHAVSERTTLAANLGVGYDLVNDRTSITTAFAGAPGAAFTTKGIDPSPWLARGGLGVVYQANEQLQLTARYDVEGRNGFTNQTASVKMRWAF